ncbi:Hydrogenase maturation factor [Salegentibacter echinorum]|uniref:Hydrogenase maturation factor n=1 Tax=Salegentibacter echinorum TaxID=1073325 RepID=A0A1M5KDY2_SALEC|nr:AIR synthase-related protein [Salegentibacter echinorum]SHG50905.1 Hydrogenase maturation factor [Salegentibacter echinorum]
MAKTGKIERDLLEELFTQQTGFKNSKVLQGPQFGVDTALIRTGENTGLVTASDPTSLVPSLGMKDSAWLSVVLTANDIATSGFLPQYAQFVFNFSEDLRDEELNEYWHQIHLFCKGMKISITGGHTGFSNKGPTTISGAVTMFSEVKLSLAKSTVFIKPNQDLILTKTAALSSAAILAKSFPKHTSLHLGQEMQKDLADSLYQISVLPELQILRSDKELFSQISGMHDCTEGGVLGGIYELCEASETGVEIHRNKIPLGEAQNQLCQLFDIDPYRCIAAGSLLIACPKEITKNVVNLLQENGIRAGKIGETLSEKTNRKIITAKDEEKLIYKEDPYWKAFFNALENRLD